MICNFLTFAVFFFINTAGKGAESSKCRLYPLACDAYWELLVFVENVIFDSITSIGYMCGLTIHVNGSLPAS